ncbi:MAG: hypothetical protein RLZZ618_983 [Pseudomonadota bacterium]|jgi:uncharacterized membrane protein
MNWVRSRRFWYVLMGIVPAVPLLMFALLMIGAPGSAVWFVVLAVSGFIGLCTATVIAPDSSNRRAAALALLLMLGGVAVTGTMLFYFIEQTVRDWPVVASQPVALLFFVPPTGIALHYAWAFVQALRRHVFRAGMPTSASATDPEVPHVT